MVNSRIVTFLCGVILLGVVAGSTQSSLLEKIQHVKGIYDELKIGLKDTLKNKLLNKENIEDFKQLKKQVVQCYNSSVGKENLNIFEQPLRDVIHKYFKIFKTQYTEFAESSREKKLARVKSFYQSLRGLGRDIIVCVKTVRKNESCKKLNETNNGTAIEDCIQPVNQLGLTSLSGMTDQEFEEKILLGRGFRRGLGRRNIPYQNNSGKLNGRYPRRNSSKRRFAPQPYDDRVVYDPRRQTGPKNGKSELENAVSRKSEPNPFFQYPTFVAYSGKLWKSEQNKNPLCKTKVDKNLPAKFSWAEKAPGSMSEIFNQGSCGSCYIVSTVDALETQYRIKARKNAKDLKDSKLSVQEILDCDPHGCAGGVIYDALKYMQVYGVGSSATKPYRGTDTSKCVRQKPILKAESYCRFESIRSNNHLKTLLKNIGPIVVGIIAGPRMKNLRGKFDGSCGKGVQLNHAVMLIGWDEKYWIIKNSWSRNWGKDGYLYMSIKSDCGIKTLGGAVFPEMESFVKQQ